MQATREIERRTQVHYEYSDQRPMRRAARDRAVSSEFKDLPVILGDYLSDTSQSLDGMTHMHLLEEAEWMAYNARENEQYTDPDAYGYSRHQVAALMRFVARLRTFLGAKVVW